MSGWAHEPPPGAPHPLAGLAAPAAGARLAPFRGMPPFHVIAERIRSEDLVNQPFGKRIFDGVLPAWPVVGHGMVILYCHPRGRRLLTSPVRRVLCDVSDPRVVYVETANSTYRVYVHAGGPR